MRHDDVSSEITGRATGFPNVPAQMKKVSASPVRYETKMSKQEYYCAASYGEIYVMREQESAEAIVAQYRK